MGPRRSCVSWRRREISENTEQAVADRRTAPHRSGTNYKRGRNKVTRRAPRDDATKYVISLHVHIYTSTQKTGGSVAAPPSTHLVH
eukprot:815387-Prymnesium_polylepis.1